MTIGLVVTMPDKHLTPTLAIVGGGPAGLMAAETARAAGVNVDVYEAKGSVGRKFLIAGKGGLNLTHSESYSTFLQRYGSRSAEVAKWLAQFSADDVCKWAQLLGVETFVGTSGRIFPSDMKAAPLLRAWVKRLREQGVRFHVRHRCVGVDANRTLVFHTPGGEQRIQTDAIIFALGGGSWPQLGSDGAWVQWLRESGVDIAELESANCGFDVAWSEVFAKRFAGQPIKSVAIAIDANVPKRQGEFVIAQYGVEGSLIYSLSAELRDRIRDQGTVQIHLDLAPDVSVERVRQQLSQPRGGRSITEHLRRTVGIEGVKMGLLYEMLPKNEMNEPDKFAAAIKSLPLTLLRPRPLAEAISTAGGIRFESLNEKLMMESLPGVFCAGEMIDWEAPTGGYLLTACFASGKLAGQSAAEWLLK
jgi:uncharacterized flavoprotein (TIGR03862 family)